MSAYLERYSAPLQPKGGYTEIDWVNGGHKMDPSSPRPPIPWFVRGSSDPLFMFAHQRNAEQQIYGKLKTIEEKIRSSDGSGIVARWQSGRLIHELRGGAPQLPKGLARELRQKLGVSKSEACYRAQFACTFREEHLPTVLERCRNSWRRIIQELKQSSRVTPTKPKQHTKQTLRARIRQLLADVEDGGDLNEAEYRLAREHLEALERLFRFGVPRTVEEIEEVWKSQVVFAASKGRGKKSRGAAA